MQGQSMKNQHGQLMKCLKTQNYQNEQALKAGLEDVITRKNFIIVCYMLVYLSM